MTEDVAVEPIVWPVVSEHFDPTFACSCSTWVDHQPTESDGQRDCAVVRAWVAEFLGWKGETTPPEYLMTRIVHSLNNDYHAHIEQIDADQWCGISAETYPGKWDEATNKLVDDPEQFHTFIACDRIEDGFAYTLLSFANKYGRKRDRD